MTEDQKLFNESAVEHKKLVEDYQNLQVNMERYESEVQKLVESITSFGESCNSLFADETFEKKSIVITVVNFTRTLDSEVFGKYLMRIRKNGSQQFNSKLNSLKELDDIRDGIYKIKKDMGKTIPLFSKPDPNAVNDLSNAINRYNIMVKKSLESYEETLNQSIGTFLDTYFETIKSLQALFAN